MPAPGKVYLVGAGPGAPGLITVRGLHCLRQADLVLYDGLVHPLLLREARPDAHCEIASSRTIGQPTINARLIAAAQAGQTVVRLKGGDPFIFGRGGEEAAALAEAGIDFEVIPGVTAAIAAGEYAGISFTHRELSSAVAFVTGHEDPAKEHSSVDYAALAAFPGTLVIYMGLHRLESIIAALTQAGMSDSTPACVVSHATTATQKSVSATLAQLAEAVLGAGMRAPSIIIIGECVRQREAIAWFEKRPLFGRRIGVTRPDGQSQAVIARLLELGAEPVLMPTIEIQPPDSWEDVDRAIDRLQEFDWLIFTSVNGVDGFLNRLWLRGGDGRSLANLKIAAIGRATGGALERFGLRPDLVPAAYRAEALAAELLSRIAGRRVLWARANRGREVLIEQLSTSAAAFETTVVYQNVDVAAYPPPIVSRLESGELDWVALGSPSIAENFRRLCPPAALARLGQSIRLASISPVTSERARSIGLPIAAEAVEYTWEGLSDAILRAENAK